jgi:NDP-sugar pyrophosphorylase family protein
MGRVRVLPAGALGHGFVPAEFLPEGQDENYLRDEQIDKDATAWRPLRADEIDVLVKNGVTCSDWKIVYVSDPFTPHLVKNCEFSGLMRIGRLEDVVLEHHDLKIPAGISNSLIISCDLGDNVAIHNVSYLAHYIIGDNAILLSNDEMNTTSHAKFGNGIIKDGESEETRIWLDLMNEAGGRAVLPFDGMIVADAYIWANYRDDIQLQERLKQITQDQFDSRRGFFGVVGAGAVIKNCRILKDVRIGPSCYIKGANKLKNLTINSTDAEPTQIGEGVELVNGIIGFGSSIFYGCKAVRFVIGNNANLKYGARLIHSFLGDNSTISCGEILNNLIFPAHEQHHNNSFLIAALVMGQSNIAAGATLGSNHNSRANDGEMRAGRGFWPGLCTTLKHSSRFSSFIILANGDYPAELNVPLPFSLVSNDLPNDRLRVMPAYWWNYNMYALARNTWKYEARDRRKTKSQHIEFQALAPDTAEEILQALDLLEVWTGRASLVSQQQQQPEPDRETLAGLGRELLRGAEEQTSELEILAEGIENSHRKVVINKARKGYHAYRDMLHHYAITNILDYLRDHPEVTGSSLHETLGAPREHPWVNLGGQITAARDVDALRTDIKSGKLNNWEDIHREYDRLWAAYPLAKQRHAYAILLEMLATDILTSVAWSAVLDEAVRIQTYVCDQVCVTRKKDYQNSFRQATFESTAEMESVLGTVEDNSFVKQVRTETSAFMKFVESVRPR